MIKGLPKQTVENFRELSRGRKIVLYGFDPQAVRAAVRQYSNFECIIDFDSERWGMQFESLQIFPPEHLYSLRPETHLILVTAKSTSVYSKTRAIKVIDNFDVFFYSVLSDSFFGYFSNQLYDNLERLDAVERLLADDQSKRIFREVICRRIMGATGEYKSLKITDNPQYIFGAMFENMNSNEVFLDCGGYIGDSVEKFVFSFGNKVKKIYSFECFEENIEKLHVTGERMAQNGWTGELVVVPYAVSDKNETAVFNDLGKSDSGYLPETRLTTQYNAKLAPISTVEVATRTIDSFVNENERITLIKMDIEGAEYAALKGAEKTIRTYHPRLAISIYHNPCDYWRILELIHEFSPEYKFAIRHHQNNHLDTVLYAWQEEK